MNPIDGFQQFGHALVAHDAVGMAERVTIWNEAFPVTCVDVWVRPPPDFGVNF